MNDRSWLWRFVGVALFSVSSLVLQGSSCFSSAIQQPVDQVTQAFNNAVNSLNSNSGQWQVTIQALENKLIQQGQSTLANEVQSVLNRGIATTSAEFRCDVKFLGDELAEALQVILARFHGNTPPPPPPHFCTVDPDSIDLRLTPDRRPATLNVYGFNFTSNNISLAVVDQDGSRNTPAAGIFTVPTEFKATLNIVNYPFAATSRYVSFSLPAGEERRVTITQAATCAGIGQPCCSVGTPCDLGAGCLNGVCTSCPPPAGPPLQREVFTKSNEFCGNNCGGQDVDRTYGRACDNGFHREQCAVAIVDSCDVCTRQSSWASSDPSDCTCIVHFHTPADCFKGMHVNIVITETQNAAMRPAGCP